MAPAALRCCAALLLAALAGCSLVSFKSPERPLSARDMNARILTRELTTHFLETNARSMETILRSETDPAVINNTLRWEVGVIVASRNVQSPPVPLLTLLGTCTFALQLHAFKG